MDKVFDACGFQLFHTSRSTCNNENSSSVQCLECRNSIFCVFIIAGTDNYDVCTGFHSCFDTGLYCGEAQIVDYFVTGTSQEVA